MHEYSIIQSLLDRAEGVATEHGATGIHRLKVRIGELSGVEIPLLASAFEVFRKGSLCSAADLEIEAVPARWVCPRCGRTFHRGEFLRCGECGVPARLEEGDEIILARVEMEVPDV
ncbi:MAG: hydrogenase maturation nickel metallochaperone HypA [Acidobacteria bacterium]|nr:hydrogenase maturation nickel metallochaperone HypA [Acidobacteriota bacterium]